MESRGVECVGVRRDNGVFAAMTVMEVGRLPKKLKFVRHASESFPACELDEKILGTDDY
jgi:hypothetical protein